MTNDKAKRVVIGVNKSVRQSIKRAADKARMESHEHTRKTVALCPRMDILNDGRAK